MSVTACISKSAHRRPVTKHLAYYITVVETQTVQHQQHHCAHHRGAPITSRWLNTNCPASAAPGETAPTIPEQPIFSDFHTCPSSELKASSKRTIIFTSTRILQHRSIDRTIRQTDFIPGSTLPENTQFLSFHKTHHTAAAKILTMAYFLVHNQHLAMTQNQTLLQSQTPEKYIPKPSWPQHIHKISGELFLVHHKRDKFYPQLSFFPDYPASRLT
jgi:hypothetical protein